jgi:hypothetical protein
MTSHTELADVSGQIPILKLASAEVSDDDLTMEEMLYLQVYQKKLEDAGFVVDGAPPNTPVPWSFRHNTPLLTKLRLIRWFAFFMSAAVSLGTGIYLLVTTVQVKHAANFFSWLDNLTWHHLLQGYQNPSLRSSPEFIENGMYVPMFAVCGTILQPVAYDMSDDQVGV